MRRILIIAAVLAVAGCASDKGPLPRGKAPEKLDKAMSEYFQAVSDCSEELHSIMVVQHGKVLAEKFFVLDTAHVLHSVSKTQSRKGFCLLTTRSWTYSPRAFPRMHPIPSGGSLSATSSR